MDRVGVVAWVPFGKVGYQLCVVVGEGRSPSWVTVRKYRDASRTWTEPVPAVVSRLTILTHEELRFLHSGADPRQRLRAVERLLTSEQRVALHDWLLRQGVTS